MTSPIRRGDIRPKLSSLPKQKTEAAAYLDSYKLAVEKKRLLQELSGMEQRRQQILRRLALIERQTSALDQSIHNLRSPLPAPAMPEPTSEDYMTFFLDY